MARSGIEVRGLTGLQRLLTNVVPSLKREVKGLTEATGRLIEADAKRRAPVNTGKLRQSITYEPVKGGFGASISVNVPYGWILEFGAGDLVSIPEGFESYAKQFRGKGKRHINIPPHPYMIPAWLKYKDQYYQELQERLNRLFR